MIIAVNGFEEAKQYPVMFNNSEILMDNNRNVFYVKAVDGIGKYTITTYEFHQIENEKPLTPENFVSREQFQSLEQKLDVLIRELGVDRVGQQRTQ